MEWFRQAKERGEDVSGITLQDTPSLPSMRSQSSRLTNACALSAMSLLAVSLALMTGAGMTPMSFMSLCDQYAHRGPQVLFRPTRCPAASFL